ncbi:MAG TPA: zinc ribbon domain-containing protein [Pyrinomonadaceae bacterium]|nr:zinc ribbon domain-containing protein [Pyrinomonadaceae bacterium]
MFAPLRENAFEGNLTNSIDVSTFMFCPQCGTESQSTQYCRTCGANLKVIGKAVALSEAVARSDRGPLPKIREMVKGLKVDHVSDEVSGALDRMNQEIASISPESKQKETRPFISFGRKKTPAEKREAHISKGVVSFFSGIGLTVFLYFLSTALVLKLPPEVIAQIPFEIDPIVRVIWLLGLLPVTSGVGHIIAGLLIRPQREQPQLPQVNEPPVLNPAPISVTEQTTNLLERDRIKA